MRKAFHLLLCTVVSSLLASCSLGLNASKPLSSQINPAVTEAIVVYGLVVEDSRAAPEQFSVTLDEYDVKSQKITGNCWRYNHTEASIPRSVNAVQYFVFSVPPGSYIYSAFHGNKLDEPPVAYEAESGKVAYVGVFAYTSENRVEVRRNIQLPKAALRELADRLELADTHAVEPPGMFLCGP